MRTDEIDACKLRAYRALHIVRILRREQSRPDWKACVAFQLTRAAQLTRRAARLQLEAKRREEARRADQLEAALTEPLMPWELELQETAVAG